jgi:hypothetical protein
LTWTDHLGSLLVLLTMAALLRSSFELRRPSSVPAVVALPSVSSEAEEERAEKREEWSRNAIEGYARAQEKKWAKWDDVMFKAKLA